MLSKSLKTALAASIVFTSGAGSVAADNLGAALVGGLIGGAIVNEVQRNNRNNRTTRRSTSSTYSAARVQNRETQTSLNYFGFPAGTPDGVMGRKSRTAIGQYQAFMGLPTTGELTPYERDFLVSSYSRAQIGGPQVIKAMQGNQGVRGLLHVWRDEAAGVRSTGLSYSGSGYGGMPIEVSQAVDEIAASSDPSAEQLLQRSGFMHLADLNGDGKNDYMIDTSVSGSSFWCGATHCSVMVFASTPQGYQRNDFMARGVTTASFSCHQGVCRMNEDTQMASAAAPAAPAPGGTVMATATAPPAPTAAAPAPVATAPAPAPAQPLAGIQLFAAPAAPAATLSLASQCSKLSLLTGSNGGYMTAATMTDPEVALGEQFCLARSYAINSGEGMVAKLGGVTQAQVDSQCDAFGPAVQPFLAKLGTSSSQALVGEVQKFVLQSNMSIEQLANTAGICMFSGYRRDNMEVALGAALIMVGIGQRPYAELLGHHLSQGFGVEKSTARAQDWYGLALTALEAGAEPVFAPGQPERSGLIKAASAGLSGGAMVQPVPAAASGTALPTFSSD
ncbi:peptidoglycan-binding domain-containing protein [Pseudophaeobacter flagellatus]|uniref:peptidoglycan-binding domain-containing protein n=1 Tax=Pseudophaeobacter flagellatus TaxID=2899119 RepID=UPI001E2E3523|nr:peptidoglycan-binding domain-containing protein [Pseudophaeobacter flagellatus]MCD9148482.1 peptidoglycan-binding protein [Pseudophaeobacter flagellatus]